MFYPVYKSIRIYRKRDDPANKYRLLKFWMIVYLLEMSQRWFAFAYAYLDVTSYLFVVLYGVLLYENFKYAELAYHFFIEEMFYRNQQRLSSFSETMSSYFDSTWRTWFEYIVKVIFNIFHVIAGFLPESIQGIVKMFVSTAEGLVKSQVKDDSATSESDTSSQKGD